MLDLATRFRRTDHDPLANDAALDQPEFEFVVCARPLARCSRQQLGLSLDFQRGFPATVKIGAPHLDPGFLPAPPNELFSFGRTNRSRCWQLGLFGRLRTSCEFIRHSVAIRCRYFWFSNLGEGGADGYLAVSFGEADASPEFRRKFESSRGNFAQQQA